MYEFVENLEKNNYENFVLNNDKAHFMQSYYWGEIQKEKNFKPYYIGLKKNGILVAVSLLLEKKVFKHIGYMYAPRGPILDYNDTESLEVFIKYLKKFTKKKKDMFLRIDPDIIINKINSKEETTKYNSDMIEILKKNGFKHSGFNKNFENNQPRFTFRLDISDSIENIYAGFHATTRKILNKGNIYKLNIYKGNLNDINDFYLTMKETALREKIIPSKIEYYKNYYTILNNQNMSDLYIIKVNIETLKEEYENIMSSIKKEIETINSYPQKNELKCGKLIEELNSKIHKMEEELLEINNIIEKELTLSSIITTKYKDKVWTVHGGNHSKLRFLNANYLLYYEIIKDAHDENYKVVDFFGTTGDSSPNNSVYGIHLFKKRFGGDYIEFIGQFDLITNKVLYLLYNIFIKTRKKLKKGFN